MSFKIITIGQAGQSPPSPIFSHNGMPPNLWHVPPNLWHVPPNLWHVPQLSALSMRSQENPPPGVEPENALQGLFKGMVDGRPGALSMRTPPGVDPENALQGVLKGMGGDQPGALSMRTPPVVDPENALQGLLKGMGDDQPGALSMRSQENPPPGMDPQNAPQGVLKGLREQLTTVNENFRDIQKTMKDEHKNMLLQMTTLRESMSKHADETVKQHRVQAEKTQEMQTQIAHSSMNPDLAARLENLCGDFKKHSEDTHTNISELQAHLDKMEAALHKANAPYFPHDLEESRMIPVAENVHQTPWPQPSFLPQAIAQGHAYRK